jgi:hypothetical protein
LSDGAVVERLAHEIDIGLHELAVLKLTDRHLYTDSRFPARGACAQRPPTLDSVQAHCLQLVFPGVGDRCVLGIGEHDRRPIRAK